MSKEYDLGNIKIYVEDTYGAMSAKAAEIFVTNLNNKPDGVYGFATGSTPIGLYKELIKKNQNGEINFSGITTYNLDEYYPIARENDQSYDYFMREKLFNHIDINGDNINLPNGQAEDPAKECFEYEEKIRASGGIDLQILGIGANGHIGFNEPDTHFAKNTRHISLAESTIEANSRFFESADLVPRHALTMGIKTIMQAKKILLVVNSVKKSEILNSALFGDITPDVPASILQLHPDVSVIIDIEAASLLDAKKLEEETIGKSKIR